MAKKDFNTIAKTLENNGNSFQKFGFQKKSTHDQSQKQTTTHRIQKRSIMVEVPDDSTELPVKFKRGQHYDNFLKRGGHNNPVYFLGFQFALLLP